MDMVKMKASKIVPTKMGCIYHAVNLKNRKGYVGQYGGEEAERRWEAHVKSARHGSKFYFHRALCKNKYEKGFSWEVIWRGPVSKLNEMEVYYIAKLHTFVDDPEGGGYNLTRGGKQPTEFSKRTRKKLSASSVRMWATFTPEKRSIMSTNISAGLAEYLAKPGSHETIRNRMRGLHVSKPNLRWTNGAAIRLAHIKDPSINVRQSEAALRRYEDPKEREKAGRARRGVKVSDGTKVKIAAKLTGRKHNPETTRKRAASNTGKKRSPEACARIRAGILQRKAERPDLFIRTPEQRTANSKRVSEFFSNPKNREAVSAKAKEVWKRPAYRTKTSAAIALGHAARRERLASAH